MKKKKQIRVFGPLETAFRQGQEDRARSIAPRPYTDAGMDAAYRLGYKATRNGGTSV